MTEREEIAALKARIDMLEDEFILLHDSLNKRIDDIQTREAQKISIWGLAIAIIIGGIQIALSLLGL